MKKIIILMLAVVMVLGLNFGRNEAHALILTFEDVPGGSTEASNRNMPTYQGYNFSSTLHWIDVEGYPWPYGAHSGQFGILNSNSGVGFITKADSGDFTFDGLWAKRWYTQPQSGGADSLFGTLSGYNNGGEVWSVGTGLNGSYEFYGAQNGAIDELRLGFGNNYLVDDIALSHSSGSNVIPEPATMLLLGSGFIGGVFARRKRKA
jgi:hypothetical protein